MSQDALEKIIRKAITDGEFYAKLSKNPDCTIAEDKTKLTPAEVALVKALNSETFGAFKEVFRRKEEKRWWMPTSFREGGSAILSGILIALLELVIGYTYILIGTDPHTVDMGGSKMMVDPYSRATGLLGVVFPLFTAVVSFWLGAGVEGRRADQNMTLEQIPSGFKG